MRKGSRTDGDTERHRKAKRSFSLGLKDRFGFFCKTVGLVPFCYTQLYDIEQEQNGLYTYERKPRVDPERFRRILSQPAAIESPK